MKHQGQRYSVACKVILLFVTLTVKQMYANDLETFIPCSPKVTPTKWFYMDLIQFKEYTLCCNSPILETEKSIDQMLTVHAFFCMFHDKMLTFIKVYERSR